MPRQQHGKLALESFHYSFLVPVFEDWDRKNDLSSLEVRVVEARIVEACCWLLLGMDVGYFSERETQHVLKDIGREFTKNLEIALVNSGHLFDSTFLSRLRTLVNSGSALRQPMPARGLLLRFGTVLTLAGEFMRDGAVQTFLAALLFLPQSGWQYLATHASYGRVILESREADFHPWLMGNVGLVYSGLLGAIQHLENLLSSLSLDKSPESESISQWALIRIYILWNHAWWFNLDNEQIKTRFKTSMENFASISSEEIAMPNNNVREALISYGENLIERWKDFTRPRAATIHA